MDVTRIAKTLTEKWKEINLKVITNGKRNLWNSQFKKNTFIKLANNKDLQN